MPRTAVAISQLRVVMSSLRCAALLFGGGLGHTGRGTSPAGYPRRSVIKQVAMAQSRGFVGRRGAANVTLPPGQYLTEDFPVLSAGPTPHVSLEQWEFVITTESGQRHVWNWAQFQALP